jgi:hypothetical protein
MAKLSGPLLSESAHGTLGGVLTYSTKKKLKQVRYQRAQKDYENPARTAQRELYKEGIEYWNSLSVEEKAQYHAEGAPYGQLGLNFFMSRWLRGLIAVGNYLLLEDGNALLLEDGGKIKLEG